MSAEVVSPEMTNSYDDDRLECRGDDPPDAGSDSSSGEEEEEDEDEPENEGENDISIPVKRQDLVNIIEDLKNDRPNRTIYHNFDLTKEEDVKKFMNENKAYTDKSPEPQKQNMLHLLAEDSDKDAVKKLSKLITALVKLPGDLLARKDDSGNTPLHKAISYRNRRLVRYMCAAHDDIDRVLAIQTFKSANCLHLALEKRSSTRDDSVLLRLIDKSNEDTLCAVNEMGLTPLHLAVAHNLCDDAQLKIVQELIAKCDRAITANKMSRLGSPYRYHVHTCEEAAEKRRTEAVPDRPSRVEETGPKAKGIGKPYSKTDKKTDLAAGDKPQPSLEEKRNRAQMKPVQISLGEEAPGKYKDAPKPGRAFLARSATFEDPTSPVAPPSVNGDEKKRTTSKKTGTAKIQPTEISVSAIKQYLKKYIMRTRNHDQAMQLLYGTQQGR